MACVGDTTDTLWFRILALITTGLVVGYSIANIVYYNRLRHSASTVVSSGEATSMFIFSIIILLLSLILFIVVLVRIFLGSKERSHLIGKAVALANTTGGIVSFSPDGSTIVTAPSSHYHHHPHGGGNMMVPPPSSSSHVITALSAPSSQIPVSGAPINYPQQPPGQQIPFGRGTSSNNLLAAAQYAASG